MHSLLCTTDNCKSICAHSHAHITHLQRSLFRAHTHMFLSRCGTTNIHTMRPWPIKDHNPDACVPVAWDTSGWPARFRSTSTHESSAAAPCDRISGPRSPCGACCCQAQNGTPLNERHQLMRLLGESCRCTLHEATRDSARRRRTARDKRSARS